MSISRAACSSRIPSSSGTTSDRPAVSAFSTDPVTCGRESVAPSRAFPAAEATVVPKAAASTTCTDISGSHSSSQTSLKVPLEATRCRLPQVIPRISRRRSSWDLARSRGLRRSRESVLGVAVKAMRRLLAVERRSASRGTMGTPSGTLPSASPMRTSRVAAAARTVLPSHMTDRTASFSSSRPAMGRPRSAARLWASRAASMMWAEETGRS